MSDQLIAGLMSMRERLKLFGDQMDGDITHIDETIAHIRTLKKQVALLATPQSSAPVVDEVVAWAVDREGDRTFPRIYATEAEADHMVFNVTVNPPATKRVVSGYEAVKAALTTALGKGEG